MAVYNDSATLLVVQHRRRTVRQVPGPARGRRHQRDHRGAPRRAAVQRPAAQSFDPPKHTAHRGLLMRLITPKRLKENEEFMWRLADRQIDEFVDRGECEFIHDYANPFTLLVIADLLGVPEADHDDVPRGAAGRPAADRATASTGEAIAHKPLEFLYERFTAYIEERRREPRDDVMTELATATFPDGSLPEVNDVMLIAANLFAAGQETTARLLGTMLRYPRRAPRAPAAAAGRPRPHPELHRGGAAAREPDPGRSSAVAASRRRSAASTSPPAPP